MLRRQIPTALFLGLVLVLATTLTTLAKEESIVTLDASVPTDPQPGSELTIGWTIHTPGENGERLPFNAEGMFVRLFPPSGEPVEAMGRQDPPGHYVATVTAPVGGIRAIEVGLRGESCTAGTCERSDIVFQIDESAIPAIAPGVPAKRAADAAQDVPPTTASPAIAAGDPQPVGLAGLGLVIIALVVGVAFLRGRGRALTPG